MCVFRFFKSFKVFLGLVLFLLALYSFLLSAVSCEERKGACTYSILGCSVLNLKFVFMCITWMSMVVTALGMRRSTLKWQQ